MWIYLSVAVLLIVVILFTRVNINIDYLKTATQYKFRIKIYVYKIRIPVYSETPRKKKDTLLSKLMKRLEWTKSKEIEQEAEQPNIVNKFLAQTDRIKETIEALLKYLRYKILCDRFNLDVEFGTGNAAVTAVSTGVMWAAAYDVYALLSSYIKIKGHSININPYFGESKCDVRFYGIFGTRVIHIINMIFMTLVYILKSSDASTLESDKDND